jgi:hypothetical protein
VDKSEGRSSSEFDQNREELFDRARGKLISRVGQSVGVDHRENKRIEGAEKRLQVGSIAADVSSVGSGKRCHAEVMLLTSVATSRTKGEAIALRVNELRGRK